MTHKITFELSSQICFIDRPVFDSILARCYILEKYGGIEQNLSIDNVDSFDDLPIKKHGDGYFLSSIMFFDKALNSTGSWKKRWQNKHDGMVDFGKTKRRVQINKGGFKSYDTPLNLYSIKKIWFYFEGDPDKVRHLVSKRLVGIGKKVSQGFGWFSRFEITASDKDFDTELLRPIPLGKTKLPGELRYCGWKPPYWLPENMCNCVYPKDLK